MYLVPVTVVEPSLAWLLAPLAVETFLDDVFAGGHHHIKRGRPDYFAPLLRGSTALDELLEHLRPESSAVHAVRGDQYRDFEAYRLADDTLDITGVRKDLAEGYTIILEHLERYVRAITGLSHTIEIELDFATQVNAYITPPESAGLLPHYDHHDVVILQIQGSKTWHLYSDTAVAPLDMQRRKEVAEIFGTDLPAPTDLVLQAGDTLYLPRGQVHAAEAGPEQSIHLTVGIHVPSVLTLLTHMLQLLSFKDDRIHTRLPARHLGDANIRESLRGIVGDALDILSDPDVIAGGLDAFEDLLVRRGRCPPVGQVSSAVDIGVETVVVKHRPLYSRVINAEDRVALQFAQLLISAGSDHESAMRFLSRSSEPFRVGDLPGLTANQQVELARSLLTSGFLARLPAD